MKTIFEKTELENLIHRCNNLNEDSKNLWGKMSAIQMLCHASDPIRDVLGIRETIPVTPPEMHPQIKSMVMVAEDWPHNLPTFPPYLQEEGGGGTEPTNFEEDRKNLIQLLNQLFSTTDASTFHPHAGIGVLTRQELGKFVWKHTDHHLRSFGV